MYLRENVITKVESYHNCHQVLHSHQASQRTSYQRGTHATLNLWLFNSFTQLSILDNQKQVILIHALLNKNNFCNSLNRVNCYVRSIKSLENTYNYIQNLCIQLYYLTQSTLSINTQLFKPAPVVRILLLVLQFSKIPKPSQNLPIF